MGNYSKTIKYILLTIILAFFDVSTIYAAQLWVAPTEVTFEYNGVNSTSQATVTVFDFDGTVLDFNATISTNQAWLNTNTTILQRSGSFIITVDEAVLKSMEPGSYSGTVTVNSNIGMAFVSVKLINQIARTEEEWHATSDWLDMYLSVPSSELSNDDLFVLMEHPTLLPGKVYAYRCERALSGAESDCRLDLFSEWGHLMPGAEEMYYDSDSMLNQSTGMVEIPFGGFRLIGLEGDIIVTAVAGTPEPGMVWGKRQLARRILHITPISGTWVITEVDHGVSTTYADPNDPTITYPMTIFEQQGQLAGDWLDPNGLHTLSVTYANPEDKICDDAQIVGSRLQVSNCQEPGLYNIYMQTPTIFGTYEFLYKITRLYMEGSYIAGQWQYKELGDSEWSIPQPFSGVKQYTYLWQYSASLMPGKRGFIEVGLNWKNVNDLDLLVEDPSGEVIYYGHTTSASGGALDVDSNAGCAGNLTSDAWEHIVWVNNPPRGEYTVKVNFYERCDNAPLENAFRVIVKVGDKIQEFTGTVDTPSTDHEKNAQYVTTFVY